MPKIEISLEDLNKLVGGKINKENLQDALEYVKGEVEEIDGDRVKIEIADTNRPDLWSTEGIARELKARYTKDKGLRKYEIKKSGIKVFVDKNLKDIRPLTVCAVVKGLNIDDETLFQMIQLQEKICENFGRKRKEVALGIYDLHKISPPIYYKAYKPNEIKFVPLDFDREMYLNEILSLHPKGKEYGHLLEGKSMYPIFIDSKGNVLSMPPIINSDYSGKVTMDTKDVFIECSGFNLRFLIPALNVMVTALAERGGKIESVEVVLPNNKRVITPDLTSKEISISYEKIKSISGLDINKKQIKELLLKARYNIKKFGKKFVVYYPAYRQDIMHEVDVIEDIIINYGYNKIIPVIPKVPSIGKLTEINTFSKKIVEIMIGLGSQEILSYILTNRETMINKMNINEIKLIELENPISKNWCVFRAWLLPCLMEFLSHNTDKEYPQNIFEIGEVVIFDETAETRTRNPTLLAWAYAGSKANFTKAKQHFEFISRNLGLEYKIEESQHPSFIEGRVGDIFIKNKKIGCLGEIHPKVLENFGITQPVCAFEINLSDILEILKS